MSTTETPPQTLLARPKRADARRNYEKVLAAAREAFAEGGESTSLEEIARRAGVGIGTLYRHFPNRQALLEALYVDEVEEVCRSAAELEGGDPGRRSTAGSSASSRYIGTKRALAARAAQLPRPGRAALPGLPRVALRRPASRCSTRAQEAGVVRPDVDIARGHPDGRRDREDPGRATPSRPSTSCASPSTACATAPRPRRPHSTGVRLRRVTTGTSSQMRAQAGPRAPAPRRPRPTRGSIRTPSRRGQTLAGAQVDGPLCLAVPRSRPQR